MFVPSWTISSPTTLTYNFNSLQVSATRTQSGGSGLGGITFDKLVDITNYSTINVIFGNIACQSDGNTYYGVGPNANTQAPAMAIEYNSASPTSVQLSVSSLSGNMIVGIGTRTDVNKNSTFNVQAVFYE